MFAIFMDEIVTGAAKSNLVPSNLKYDVGNKLFSDTATGLMYVYNQLNDTFYKITGEFSPFTSADAVYNSATGLITSPTSGKSWVFNQAGQSHMVVWPNSGIKLLTPTPTPTPTTGQIRIKVLLNGQPVDAKGIVLHMESPGLITNPTARDIPAAGSTYQKPIGNNLLIFDGGTPAGTEFIDIQPLGTQTVVADRETVWTLNFKTKHIVIHELPPGCPPGTHLDLTGTCTPDVPTPAPTPVSSNNTGLLLAAVAGAYFLFFKKKQ